MLAAIVERSDQGDPRYFAEGTWHDGNTGCFRCPFGSAVLSATYGTVAHDRAARVRAVQSFNLGIRERQSEDGSFNAAGATEDPGIETIFFGVALAQAYLTLGSSLDDKSAEAWRRSLAAAAGFLDDNGWTSWYANGNIVLAETVFFALTAQITGQRQYAQQCDDLYEVLVSPPQNKWTDFGWIYTKQPTAATGSDGAAFLAEQGSGSPGFDPVYGMLQLALAADWYVFTRDARALRLANLLINHLLPRVSDSDWTIDVAGGTRRGVPGARYGFTSSALPILAFLGSRRDLLGKVQTQSRVRGKTYLEASGGNRPGDSYNFGLELGTLLFAMR